MNNEPLFEAIIKLRKEVYELQNQLKQLSVRVGALENLVPGAEYNGE